MICKHSYLDQFEGDEPENPEAEKLREKMDEALSWLDNVMFALSTNGDLNTRELFDDLEMVFHCLGKNLGDRNLTIRRE